jgi:hypothetical protein
MGTDVHGVVEVNQFPDLKGSRWSDLIMAGRILYRDSDMFGMLFGVKNSTGLTPVAERRGVPEIAATRSAICPMVPTTAQGERKFSGCHTATRKPEKVSDVPPWASSPLAQQDLLFPGTHR